MVIQKRMTTILIQKNETMRNKFNLSNRDSVYNAPTIPWDSNTYTPVSNKFIMDTIEDKLRNLGLIIKNESYKTTNTNTGLVKGVIGSYDISTDDGEFGQRLMFRNSYDKTMSFAVVAGSCCLICSNGCIAGEYQYKRIHKGVILGETSTTKEDIVTNINGGISVLQTAFENIVRQMNELKHFEVSPQDTYNILGELFFKKEVLTITQMSIIKRELQFSKNFKHLFDKDFTAFDVYNAITHSLKMSHPSEYISNHIDTHNLFKELFKLN